MAACSRLEGGGARAWACVQVWLAWACAGLAAGFTGCAIASRNELSRGRMDAGRTAEICANGLDDDRNGQVDDGCSCAPGTSQRCFMGDPSRAGKGECSWGMQGCTGKGEFGHWEACTGYGTATGCQASGSGQGDSIGAAGDSRDESCPADVD